VSKKIVLKDGTVRYRIVTDAGRDPDTGKRRQLTMTFDRKREADAEEARIKHERSRGTYVAPSKMTVSELLDAHLATATFEKEAATRACYADAFRCARDRLGHRLAQSVTRQDGEDLRDFMLTAGRKRGGTPGTGLGPRSVRLALARLTAAFDQAVEDGRLARNPFRGVRPPRYVKRERDSWSGDEARAFLEVAARDRLAAAWLMAMYGMRREEILGQRWAADVDLAAGTVTVASVRVLVGGQVLVKDAPKSQRSARTLPLPADVAAALTALHARQAAEKLAAGPAWTDSGYVVTDELGEPVHPRWFSEEFGRLVERAGVRRITLHEARHTASSLMEKAGVPDSIRAAWCGHTVAVSRGTYTHALPADLAAARDALAAIYEIG
jgi:integrase